VSDYNDFTLTQLDNGVEVWNLANQNLSASAIGFMVGCRNDPEWLDGAAHLTEHCLIREGCALTSRQVNRVMNRHLGGSNGDGMNVYTLHSHTAYGHQDLLRRKYLYEVFGTFAQIIRDGMYDLRRIKARDCRVLTTNAFNTERAAVANETAENDDFAPFIALKAALRLLYRTNPARRWGDSDLPQLSRVKLGRLKQWAQGYYVPRNMRVVLVGPTRDEAIRMVREAELDAIDPQGEWTATDWDYDRSDRVPVLENIRSQVIEYPGIKMRYAALLWPTETYGHKHSSALQVLARVLKDRIEDELRENNTDPSAGVYHPEVSWEAASSHGYLQVSFATIGTEAYAEQAVAKVLQVIDRLKSDTSEALEEDCFDRRNNLVDDFLEDYRFAPGRLSDRALQAFANGDPRLDKLKEYHHKVRAVTPDHVRQVATIYLPTDKYVRVLVRPAP
jgi:predicted Zn-dependent peptidase